MFWQCRCLSRSVCVCVCVCTHFTWTQWPTRRTECERGYCFCFWHTTEEFCSSMWNTRTHLHTLMTQTIALELSFHLSGKAQGPRLIRAWLNIDISCDLISTEALNQSEQYGLFGNIYSCDTRTWELIIIFNFLYPRRNRSWRTCWGRRRCRTCCWRRICRSRSRIRRGFWGDGGRRTGGCTRRGTCSCWGDGSRRTRCWRTRGGRTRNGRTRSSSRARGGWKRGGFCSNCGGRSDSPRRGGRDRWERDSSTHTWF